MTDRFANYPSLAGRTVLVTGGASGIGADMVRAFTANGARVAVLDIDTGAGEAMTAEIPDTLFLRCDMLDIPALKSAIVTAAAKLGPIGVLINNAANDDRRKVDAVDPEYWDWSQSVNLKHQFFAAQAVRPQMKELGGGSIINLSSIAWRYGADEMTPYVTAKSAVIGLTRALARNFGPDNIRVNAIEPGAVITERQRKLWYRTQADIDGIVSKQLLARVLVGEDIARMALFLASDDARAITKQSFIVDAGLAG
jgi:D-xylose 1-dehydrogenase